MKKITLAEITRQYKNNGQHAEQVVRFTLTGEITKADNKAYNLASDCLNYQIKSARATVCKGCDLKAYLDADAASGYIYVMADFKTAYIMNRNEYEKFVYAFGTVTRESTKNGGATKIRLNHETNKMKQWFAERE
jgi:hypothetical protein